MKAGELNRRITIERATYTVNDLNEHVPTWATLTTVWASKKDVSDSERIAAAEVRAAITTRFQIRHSRKVADLTAKDRISFQGNVYEIFSVKEIWRNTGLEITAAARVD